MRPSGCLRKPYVLFNNTSIEQLDTVGVSINGLRAARRSTGRRRQAPAGPRRRRMV